MDIPRADSERGPFKWSRRKLLRNTSMAVVGSGLGAGLYTRLIEPHWVDVHSRALPIRNLPAALDGATLVQLSDLHVGDRVDSSYLIDVFRRVSDLEPDIVVITGDYVTYSGPAVIDELGRVLEHAPRGSRATVGTFGNHDYGFRWRSAKVAAAIGERARDAGITILRNAAYETDGLQIVGMDDVWSRNFRPREALRSVRPEGPALVLSHNPDTVDQRGWGSYKGWILCGHTHGGQCKPPFLPPPILPVRNKAYTAGEFDLGDGRFMYINRGIGHTMPVRFNVRPEVTVFTLTSA